MKKRSGSLERAVIRSSVMPSLKYSWSRSPLMLVKGSTAIEGLSGNGRAGGCAGGMDADGVGGRRERCCTNMTVAAIIASPAIEKMPRRTYFRVPCAFVLAAVASAVPVYGSTLDTRHGFSMFVADESPRCADLIGN